MEKWRDIPGYETLYQASTEGRKYGVSKKTIQNAINGITWKCVQYMPDAPEVDDE